MSETMITALIGVAATLFIALITQIISVFISKLKYDLEINKKIIKQKGTMKFISGKTANPGDMGGGKGNYGPDRICRNHTAAQRPHGARESSAAYGRVEVIKLP